MSRYKATPDVEAAIELLKESGISVILNCTFKHPIDLDRRLDADGNRLPVIIENNTFKIDQKNWMPAINIDEPGRS